MEIGDYFIPMNLSEEIKSFYKWNVAIWSKKKIYSIDDLYNHEFLNKPISEFTKIDYNKYSKNIINNKKMISKNKQTL